MKGEMQNKLIAYALDFVSFLLEHHAKIEKAVLFGSVVTGEFDIESDVDIFLETSDTEESIRKFLFQFEKTRGENWKLKGIENLLSVKAGSLKKWPQLRRSIQSHGLLLYGNYKEFPEDMEHYLLFLLNYHALTRNQKVSLWRKMYGYVQKINHKVYAQQGFVSELGGKKLEKGVIALPSQYAEVFRGFLRKRKVAYKMIEVWSDDL